MVYLIDMQIKYRTEDGAIWPLDDEGSLVILTVTMNRLLAFLLERRGSVILRDEILSHVWDANGLRSSSHTLNKYISELRRTFSKFGGSESYIITVPRVGFMFSSETEVSVSDKLPADPVSSDEEQAATEVSQTIPAMKRVNIIKMAVISLLVVITALSLFYSWSYEPVKRNSLAGKNVATDLLFNFDGCEVYTLHKNSDSLSGVRSEAFRRLSTDKGIQCLPGTYFLFQPSDTYLYGHKGRIFLTRCTLSRTNKEDFASCLNYYWSDYEKD